MRLTAAQELCNSRTAANHVSASLPLLPQTPSIRACLFESLTLPLAQTHFLLIYTSIYVFIYLPMFSRTCSLTFTLLLEILQIILCT